MHEKAYAVALKVFTPGPGDGTKIQARSNFSSSLSQHYFCMALLSISLQPNLMNNLTCKSFFLFFFFFFPFSRINDNPLKLKWDRAKKKKWIKESDEKYGVMNNVISVKLNRLEKRIIGAKNKKKVGSHEMEI